VRAREREGEKGKGKNDLNFKNKIGKS